MIVRTAKAAIPQEVEMYTPQTIEVLKGLPCGVVQVVFEGRDGRGNQQWQGIAHDLPSLNECLDHVKGATLEVSAAALLALRCILGEK